MSVILWLSAACAGISILYYVAASVAALAFARRAAAPPPPLPKIAPRVAILKPLHGMRKCLFENLRSYLELDYPRTEYWFAVSSYDDRAADVPVALKAAQQGFAQITLLVGLEPGCENRKVAKLIRMADRADKAEIFVLSDSDVAVERDHLRRIVGELCASEKTGIVTSIYRGRANGTTASLLEALFVNTDFAPQVMLSAAIEPVRYALGATIAIKRAALEKLGGFRRLKDLLADDYFLGKLAADAGYQVRLSGSVVTTSCEEQRFGDFWRHQLRWARTYRTTRPVSIATIILHGPSWAILFLLATGFALSGWLALITVLVARLAMAYFMVCHVLGVSECRRDLWLVPFKDLVMTGIWFASLTGREVEWGGRRFRILPGGVMQPTHE